MGRYPMPTPDDEASVRVIVDNLRSGLGTLLGTPTIRSLFIVGSFMFFSFGLWNVLLLPFSLEELGATEFQYGLQEGLTSVGFVVGSFFMARFSAKLPEPLWLVVAMVGMGVAGALYGLSTSIPVAIALVMVSGFFNAPSSIARSVLLQRNTPREMRGRVFSAFYVMRDVIFVLGMAAAGLADVVGIRQLILFASGLLFVAAAVTVFAPGLDRSTWRAAEDRLRDSEVLPSGHEVRPGHRPRPRPPRRPPGTLRAADARAAHVVPVARAGPRGTGRHPARRAGRPRVVRVLHPRGVHDGRSAGRGRLPGAVDDGRG